MNDDRPIKFSVVIPTYNREKFIVKTLDSIFRQTYAHYEIIVVDNCSTDDTEKVLQPFIETGKIRFIKHDRNYERSRSRNTGMENATGEFLTFLDSDDFMYPDNLADAAAFIEKNPEAKCFHSLYELIDGDGKVLRHYKFPSLRNQTKAIASGNFMACIGNFIHRDIYTNPKYRFDLYKPLTGAEDWEFWLRVLADFKLERIQKVNSAILHHEERTINTQSMPILEDGNDYLIKKFTADAHLSKVYAPYLSWMHANSYLYLAVMANGSHLYDDAKKYMKKAIKKDARVILTSRFARIIRRTALKL